MDQNYKIKMVSMKPAEKHSVLAGEYETILLVQHGHGQAEWENNVAFVDIESVVLLRPGMKVVMQADEKQGLKLYELRLLPKLLEYLSDDSCDLEASFSVVPFRCMTVQLPAQRATLLKRLLVILKEEQQQPEEFAHTICQKGLLELLVTWGLRACIEEERKTALVGRQHLIVDDVFAYINAHSNEPLYLKDLAAQFYVSPEHLAREFKRRTQQTLHQYITRARLSRCQELLCDGVPASNVWNQCGFSSYAAMNRSFKHEFGMSPAEYYRKCRKRSWEYPMIQRYSEEVMRLDKKEESAEEKLQKEQ